MGNYKDRMALLRDLCKQHPAIRHEEVITGTTRRKSFYKNFNDLTAGNINFGQLPSVVMGEFSARAANAEWNRTRLSNEWYFLDKPLLNPADPSFTAAQDLVYDNTEKVMMDFIQRLIVDNEDEGGCGLLKLIDRSSIRWEKAGPYGDSLYGWVLRFSDEIVPNPDMDYIPPNYWLDIEGESEQPYEMISFTNANNVPVTLTPERKSKYGSFPSVQVWIVADVTYQVWPEVLFDSLPNPGMIMVKIGGPATGFIKLGV